MNARYKYSVQENPASFSKTDKLTVNFKNLKRSIIRHEEEDPEHILKQTKNVKDMLQSKEDDKLAVRNCGMSAFKCI